MVDTNDMSITHYFLDLVRCHIKMISKVKSNTNVNYKQINIKRKTIRKRAIRNVKMIMIIKLLALT